MKTNHVQYEEERKDLYSGYDFERHSSSGSINNSR
jgi:hypothetical protein